MKTFTLTCYMTISAVTEVEAETLEQAIQIAYGRTVEPADFRNEIDEVWAAEFDGVPFNIREQE